MSVDQATVRRIAHLARIAVKDEDVPHLQQELNAILAFVEELGAVDVEGARAPDLHGRLQDHRRQLGRGVRNDR